MTRSDPVTVRSVPSKVRFGEALRFPPVLNWISVGLPAAPTLAETPVRPEPSPKNEPENEPVIILFVSVCDPVRVTTIVSSIDTVAGADPSNVKFVIPVPSTRELET